MIFSHDFDYIYLFIGIYVLLAFNCEEKKRCFGYMFIAFYCEKEKKRKGCKLHFSQECSPFGLKEKTN